MILIRTQHLSSKLRKRFIWNVWQHSIGHFITFYTTKKMSDIFSLFFQSRLLSKSFHFILQWCCGFQKGMSNFSLPQVCGQLLPSEDEFLTDLKFWGPGVAVSIIGGIGLVGNILSIIAIATLPKTRLSLFYKVSKKLDYFWFMYFMYFLQLLLTLAIFDFLFISNGGLFMIQQAFGFKVEWYNFLFPKCIYPISGFAMTGAYLFILKSENFSTNSIYF